MHYFSQTHMRHTRDAHNVIVRRSQQTLMEKIKMYHFAAYIVWVAQCCRKVIFFLSPLFLARLLHAIWKCVRSATMEGWRRKVFFFLLVIFIHLARRVYSQFSVNFNDESLSPFVQNYPSNKWFAAMYSHSTHQKLEILPIVQRHESMKIVFRIH